MRFHKNDGGRADAGYKGDAGDCGVRAVAIALGWGYRSAYKALADLNATMTGGLHRSPRDGIYPPVLHAFLIRHGWRVVLTPKAYFTNEFTPPAGVFIACLPRHYAVVIDGCVCDSWDSRKSTRTKSGAPRMLGYYTKDWS